MKTCSRCKLELPEEMFYYRARSKDKLQSYCIPCTKGVVAEWSKNNRERRLVISSRGYYNNRSKRLCSMKAWRAYAKGLIEWQPCTVCGAKDDLQMHHDDYNKPLKVRWLCRACHKRLHALEDKAKREASQ